MPDADDLVSALRAQRNELADINAVLRARLAAAERRIAELEKDQPSPAE